jgi:ribonuclease P protein component
MNAGRADQRFSKDVRLRKRSEIQRVLDQGQKRVSRHLVLFRLLRIAPSQPITPRLGIIASKKVGDAHRRNRAKRLFREVFRLNKAWFRTGEDIVLLAKRGVDTLSLKDVEKELRVALEQAEGGEDCPGVASAGPRIP